MSCNKSLPNQRLMHDEDKSKFYLERKRYEYAKQISALQAIVQNVIT